MSEESRIEQFDKSQWVDDAIADIKAKIVAENVPDFRTDHDEWSRLGQELLNEIRGAVKSARDAHGLDEGYCTSIVQRVHGAVMGALRRRRAPAGVYKARESKGRA